MSAARAWMFRRRRWRSARGYPERMAGAARAHVRDAGIRASRRARLAASAWGDPRRDGEHGIYWKPIFYVLEDAFTCLLFNAAHIAQVPGRKTDVRDCVWIAQLLEHGWYGAASSCRRRPFGSCAN